MKEQIHNCSKKQKKAARAALGCLVLLLLYGCAGQSNNAEAVSFVTEPVASQAGQPDEPQEEPDKPQEEPDIYAVYVCGAVKNPGVYELSAGSRVYEAVALAGGLAEDASKTAVNQAEPLVDGQMIRIPTTEEADAFTDEPGGASEDDGLVNINTADAEELKTLPGIGDAKAQSIISYREKNGAFQTVEDIKNIEGIKEGVFARLEGLIKVE